MGRSHVASGIFGLAIAGIAWLEARTFPLQGLQEGLGAAFMPWLVLGLIVVLSASSIVCGLFLGVGRGGAAKPRPRMDLIGGLFLALCAFAIAFVLVGLLVPVVAFLIVSMRLLGAPWARAIGVGMAAGVCIYLTFVIGFGVPLP